MPRPKEFDVEATLDRAVELFRRKGYSATSIQDLVETLGINRASLYDTFGNKEELFARSVQRYIERVIAERSGWVDHRSSLGALVNYVRQTVEWALNDRSKAGCLITNSCVELNAFERGTTQQVTGGLKGTYAFLLRIAQAAEQAHELPERVSAEMAAVQALSAAMSIPLLVKAGVAESSIRAVAEGFAQLVGAPQK